MRFSKKQFDEIIKKQNIKPGYEGLLFPKIEKVKKKKNRISKRSKKKMDNGLISLENDCMDLWRQGVSFGKDRCEFCNGTIKHTKHDCHHVFGKKAFPALKYEIKNGLYVGGKCHIEIHTQFSAFFSDWIKEFWGMERYEELFIRRNNYFPCRVSNFQILQIRLQQELNGLMKG